MPGLAALDRLLGLQVQRTVPAPGVDAHDAHALLVEPARGRGGHARAAGHVVELGVEGVAAGAHEDDVQRGERVADARRARRARRPRRSRRRPRARRSRARRRARGTTRAAARRSSAPARRRPSSCSARARRRAWSCGCRSAGRSRPPSPRRRAAAPAATPSMPSIVFAPSAWPEYSMSVRSRSGSSGGEGCDRRREVDEAGHYGTFIATYLVSRYSWMPSGPPSRPKPDCLTPPNGAPALETMPWLRPIIPVSRPSMTLKARLMSCV